MEQTTLNYPSVENYKLMVQEAGHALGLSGYSDLSLLSERGLYKMAHPDVPDTVLNYDDEVDENFPFNDRLEMQNRREPDCAPHPFDILAIYALYQTVVDP